MTSFPHNDEVPAQRNILKTYKWEKDNYCDCAVPAELFFIERGCLSKMEIGEREIYMHLSCNLYVNSTTQRCPNKIIKIFQFEDFCHLPPVSATPVVHLELRISPRIFEKIRNGPIGILRGLGETDSWKKSRKSLGTVPLNACRSLFLISPFCWGTLFR